MEFLITVDIFSIFLFKLEIYCQDKFQKLSLLTNGIFCKNRNRVETLKIQLDEFRKNCKKKNLKWHFGNYWMLYLTGFDLYIDIVLIVYMFVFLKVNGRQY